MLMLFQPGSFKCKIMGPVMAQTLKHSISLLAAMGLDVSGKDYRHHNYKLFYN